MQVIKGTYIQTNQLQGFNALAPSASQNLSSHLASAIGAAQVPSSSINEALSNAALPGMAAEVGILACTRHCALCASSHVRSEADAWASLAHSTVMACVRVFGIEHLLLPHTTSVLQKQATVLALAAA